MQHCDSKVVRRGEHRCRRGLLSGNASFEAAGDRFVKDADTVRVAARAADGFTRLQRAFSEQVRALLTWRFKRGFERVLRLAEVRAPHAAVRRHLARIA